MITKQFGEVELIREGWAKGAILCEEEDGVLLIECLDNNGKNIDVLYRFPEGATLRNKEDLYKCLVEVRERVKDLNKTIYIKVLTEPIQTYSKEEERKRKAYLEHMIARSGTHPWNFR